ncbi:ABC transporter permease [Actinomyces israelii]|uniref:ABC transporter permease n=1 Tax=Actinomyces israelii TaxID=1659 RepID=UPI0005B96D16|nr:ABC transporter permease [Actinomyces israelii]
MTTAAPPATSPAAALTGKGAARPLRTRIQGRQTFARAVGSEWIKIRSLRSTWITSAIAIVTSVLIGAGLTIGMGKTAEYADTARYSLIAGTTLGQIVVAVLAALVITGEYSSGQIRSSLAAVPHRGRLLWAKALVISFVAFLLGSLSTLLSWAISAPFLGEHAGSLTDAHYLGFFWGSGLAYAGIALMTLGLGFLLRSTAGSLTVVTVLLFVIEIPLGLMAMKWEWATKIIGLLPGRVAGAVTDPFQLTQTWGSQAGGATSFLEHSHAILVFAAWALIPMLIGWPVFSRRDT